MSDRSEHASIRQRPRELAPRSARLHDHRASSPPLERVGACPEFALESWHPAASGTAGDSAFSIAGQPAAAILRRAMIVLGRK